MHDTNTKQTVKSVLGFALVIIMIIGAIFGLDVNVEIDDANQNPAESVTSEVTTNKPDETKGADATEKPEATTIVTEDEVKDEKPTEKNPSATEDVSKDEVKPPVEVPPIVDEKPTEDETPTEDKTPIEDDTSDSPADSTPTEDDNPVVDESDKDVVTEPTDDTEDKVTEGEDTDA